METLRDRSLGVLVLTALVAGCSDDGNMGGAGTNSSGLDSSSGTSSGGGPSLVGVSATCVDDTEPTYGPFSNQVPQEPLCDMPTPVSLPDEAYLVDLSDTTAGAEGTCAPFARGVDDARVISPEVPFPLVIRLPALGGSDDACATFCEFSEPPTAFGLTIEHPALAGADGVVVLRVPAPWYLVIGNEHSPTPCLDGSPSVLEFGKPLACAATWGSHFGFATADPNAPSVDVVLDVLPTNPNDALCCPFHCAR